jgi:tRNA G18 (ribose-2'-O)-methylase SpoU
MAARSVGVRVGIDAGVDTVTTPGVTYGRVMEGAMGRVITIDDASDPRVADYRRLNDQAARTVLEGDEFFMSEGWMSIDRLIDSGHRFRSALLSPSRLNRFLPYLSRPELAGVPVYVAEGEVIDRLVGFHLPRAVLVSAGRLPLVTVDHLAATAKRLIVLEGLNDDVNVGAIARVARAFEFGGLVLSPTCTDPYVRRTVRVSMGEILHVRIARAARAEWPGALDTLHAAGFESWALTPAEDATDIWRADVPERLAVVVGAEGPGLTDAVLARSTRRVRIPISSVVDSLNVGHAAAIACAAISRRPAAPDRPAPS